MDTLQQIIDRVRTLPENRQREVLDFVEYLAEKRAWDEEQRAWSRLSVATAMRGMEDEEPIYTLADIKEPIC